ncbi:hypothetical protein TD95_003858 [Thielaviopsis punctulata]|uniref:t-SNARE coiled-coil homology domain-containing protein n=1 Tax=Thielaviopsis punctulata TaxID=72032 RepID=A0A0F4ZH04_9PEZI|nr:hypothetical protein TD95_003858 [Thielaviopsis punctulata]
MANQYSGYGGNPYVEANDMENGQNHNASARYDDTDGTSNNYNEPSHYSSTQQQYDPYLGNQQQYESYSENQQQYDPYSSNQQQSISNQQAYEMQNYSQPQSSTAQSHTTPLERNAFLEEAANLRNSIQLLNADIDSLSALHQRALSATDSSASAAADNAVVAAQQRALGLKTELARLEHDISITPAGPQVQAKTGQYNTLKNQLQDSVQRLMRTEREFGQRYREQIARQYRVANPEATEMEVRQATERDWSNEGVFQRALQDSRMRNAQSALGAVRARHNDLQHIERSLQELALLFDQIGSMVASQGVAIESVEAKASEAVDNMEEGNKQVDEARYRAGKVRKMKWCLTFVVLLIILALGLGIGLGVGLQKN